MRRYPVLFIAVSGALLGTACGSSGHRTAARTSSSTTSSSPPVTQASYRPTIDPARFTTSITNRYYPLKPGTRIVLEGTRDGQPQRHAITVTNETRTIIGVKCVVVHDDVTSNGALVEKTTDWYAQADNGDVWYFGEDTKEYTNGAVSSTHGTWEAGVDNAQPGVVMKGNPIVGDSYRQEYRPGEAEDVAKVLRMDPSLQVPGGTFRDIVVTEDSDPLNPDKVDTKSYAPGVGLVKSIRDRAGHHEEYAFVSTATA